MHERRQPAIAGALTNEVPVITAWSVQEAKGLDADGAMRTEVIAVVALGPGLLDYRHSLDKMRLASLPPLS